MATYKNTDKIISHLTDEIEACGNPDGNNEPITYGTMLGLISAKAFIETAETADVVPKSEVASIIFDDIEKMLESQEVVTENQRCKEVGAWLLHDYLPRKLAELKKKYTQELEND